MSLRAACRPPVCDPVCRYVSSDNVCCVILLFAVTQVVKQKVLFNNLHSPHGGATGWAQNFGWVGHIAFDPPIIGLYVR